MKWFLRIFFTLGTAASLASAIFNTRAGKEWMALVQSIFLGVNGVAAWLAWAKADQIEEALK